MGRGDSPDLFLSSPDSAVAIQSRWPKPNSLTIDFLRQHEIHGSPTLIGYGANIERTRPLKFVRELRCGCILYAFTANFIVGTQTSHYRTKSTLIYTWGTNSLTIERRVIFRFFPFPATCCNGGKWRYDISHKSTQEVQTKLCVFS